MSWVGVLAKRVRQRAAPILIAGLSLAARANRRRLGGVRFVAVTGSVGKTSTATLLAAVLSPRGPVHNGTVFGPNSVHRAALTVLATRRRNRYCVIEVSGHAPGAVESASRFVQPDIAVVTRVGDDHHKKFRSRAAVATEKGWLVEALGKRGLAVLNTDDPNVWAMRARTGAAVVGCGEAAEATLRLLLVDAAWPARLSLRLAHDGSTLTVRTQLVGPYGRFPVMAALAVALAEQIPIAEAVAALAAVEPLPGRMCPHQSAGVTFIDDSRKAPLYTIPATLEFMRSAQAERKILVFGTLSDFSMKAGATYRTLARDALAVADIVIFVGRWSASIAPLRAALGPDRLLAFASVAALNAHLKSLLRPGDLVLLKGSGRADHLERVLLDRSAPVACWRERCGRVRRCEGCRLLHQPG